MFKTLKKTKNVFIILIIFLFAIFLLSQGHIYNKNELEYVLTFSKKQAQNLGFNWQEVYLSILNELGIKRIR